MAAAEQTGLRGDVLHAEPMSRHTSWRVGGPAERFFKPADLDDLAAFLTALPEDVPVFWLGLGSNLLVRDGGIKGVVIAGSAVSKALDDLGGHRVRVGSSIPCTRLARQCIRWGYGPSEFFAGIPGSVGGALTMNAGAHGGETWERVESVVTIDRRGQTRTRPAADFEVGYRSVALPAGEWFVEATMAFDPSVDPSMQRQKEMLERRKTTQPLGLPSCGSVFRNPPGDHAARLIEAAGLKGYRLGGAEVSPKHANFIINTGDATAADIEGLIAHVQNTVEAAHGIRLLHEVRIVGEATTGVSS